MKSILFITSEYPTYTPFGGIAFYYQKVSDILSKIGFSVTVVTCIPQDAKILKVENPNPNFKEIYLPGNTLNQFKNQVHVWLRNKVKEKFDLIEAPEYGALLFELIKSKQIYQYCKRVTIRVHGTTILANAYGKSQSDIQRWITTSRRNAQNAALSIPFN